MPTGQARTDALRKLEEPVAGGLPPGTAVPRVFVGRDTSKVARLTLADKLGRPRLALSVDSLGSARIDFLDEAGRVTSTIPAAAGRP